MHDTTSEEFKRWVRNKLKEGSITITFFKENGEKREMTATLNMEKIRELGGLPLKKESRVNIVNEDGTTPDYQVVFDLDKGGWRTFKWNRIAGIDFKC